MASKVTQSVEFIVCEEDGRFVVREEALKMLQDIKGDISVIALAGLQRTGKSFLMNLLSRERIEDGSCIRAFVCLVLLVVWLDQPSFSTV